jgi:hypothetical protein
MLNSHWLIEVAQTKGNKKKTQEFLPKSLILLVGPRGLEPRTKGL